MRGNLGTPYWGNRENGGNEESALRQAQGKQDRVPFDALRLLKAS